MMLNKITYSTENPAKKLHKLCGVGKNLFLFSSLDVGTVTECYWTRFLNKRIFV